MYTTNTNIIIKRKGNSYLVIIQGKLFMHQPILNASCIPHHLTPATYWYMYILHILYRFGFTLPAAANILPQ